MRRLQAVAVFMVLAMATPALAGGKAKGKGKGPDPKVDVCHRKGKTGTFFVINVSINALPAHLAHGDHQAGAFYLDADGDGFGAAGATMDACQQTGYVGNNQDCNDSDAAIKPGAADALCDGVDDNCDGAADDQYAPLATSCGVGACVAAGVTSCAAGAVLDSCTPGVPVSDANCDGIDNDCDASIDEEYLPQQTFCGVGACFASGATSCVAGTVNNSCTAGQPVDSDANCDGIDGNCDGATDNFYQPTQTFCGVGACFASGATSCVAGTEQDSCSEGPAAASDTTCDGVDDNCDGTSDEQYIVTSTSCGFGVCAATGNLTCVVGQEVDSCQPDMSKQTAEICNGLNDNCDAQELIDEGVADEAYYTGDAGTQNVGMCTAGTKTCSGGQWVVSVPEVIPTTEQCDGLLDEDCDNELDEGCSNPAPAISGYGGNANVYGQNVAVDAAGNVYMSGKYLNSAPSFGSFTLPYGYGNWVTKTSPTGEVLWAKSMHHKPIIDQIEVDPNGGLLLLVKLSSIPFPWNLQTYTSTSYGVGVFKMDSDGNELWGFMATSPQPDNPEDMKVDSQGNVYFTGTYYYQANANSAQPTTTFGAGTSAETSMVCWRSCVAKLNSAGALQWVKASNSAQYSYTVMKALSVDPQDNLHIAGFSTGRWPYTPLLAKHEFGSTIYFETKSAQRPAFVAKIDGNGNWLWATSGDGDGKVHTTSLAQDSTGTLVLTLYHHLGSLPADFGPNISVPFAGKKYSTAQLTAEMSSTGVWTKAHTLATGGLVSGSGLTADATYGHFNVKIGLGDARIFQTMSYRSKYAADILGTSQTWTGTQNVLLFKTDKAGALLDWQVLGNSGVNNAYSHAVDVAGTVYIAGDYRGTLTMGTDTITSTKYNAVLWRIEDSAAPTP